jgi:hypothetical protein
MISKQTCIDGTPNKLKIMKEKDLVGVYQKLAMELVSLETFECE